MNKVAKTHNVYINGSKKARACVQTSLLLCTSLNLQMTNKKDINDTYYCMHKILNIVLKVKYKKFPL